MSRSDLINAAIYVLAKDGLTGCSVEAITAQARCAKGLLNYHFRSKRELLGEVAHALAESRMDRRLAALGQPGTRALDALWDVLLEEVSSGEARAWLLLLGELGPMTTSPRETELAKAAAGGLSLAPGSISFHTLVAVLDGTELRLLRGGDPAAVREAYDHLWLSMVPETP